MIIGEIIGHIQARIANGESFDYEAMLEGIYRQWIQPGDTVIDVGAHRGRHLGPMWQAVGAAGRVLAFEPLPTAFAFLQENFDVENISLINAAVGPEAGVAPFIFARGTPEESGFRQRVYNRPDLADPIVIEVNTTRLDDNTANIGSISFMKIDVEGGELLCLASAPNMIRQHRPVISVEYGSPSFSAFGNSIDDLHNFATSAGYAVFDIFLNDLSAIEDWRLACDTVYWDYILVPSEKVDEFLRRCR